MSACPAERGNRSASVSPIARTTSSVAHLAWHFSRTRLSAAHAMERLACPSSCAGHRAIQALVPVCLTSRSRVAIGLAQSDSHTLEVPPQTRSLCTDRLPAARLTSGCSRGKAQSLFQHKPGFGEAPRNTSVPSVLVSRMANSAPQRVSQDGHNPSVRPRITRCSSERSNVCRWPGSGCG